jgi:hypothetical protein
MVDRQDIDALLIGSLYGELSSTEEARLTAHLDSHPADRTALANLSHAREVIRESRLLQVQFDPPQSISALLMQEAARRAPKPREEASWFQRFMRSFMTHPAMAAAAMLVLIVGVAGTVYMRKGDHFAKQTADDRASFAPTVAPSTEQQPSAAPEPARGLAGGELGNAGSAASRDDYRVGLDDEALKQAEDKVVGADSDRRPTDSPTTIETKKNKKGDALAFEAKRRDQAKLSKEDDATPQLDGTGNRGMQVAKEPVVAKSPVAKTAPKPAKPASRLEVSTPSQGPKDFESTATKRGFEDVKKPADSVATGAAGAGRAPVADPKPGTAPPPPPPAAAVEEKEKQEKADPIVTWAKERHGKVIAAVRAGKCETAASIAVDISNRAPAYYASNVENDRTIKPCMQYITAQREKEAERVQRAKSTQRRAADEAPAPSRSK